MSVVQTHKQTSQVSTPEQRESTLKSPILPVNVPRGYVLGRWFSI